MAVIRGLDPHWKCNESNVSFESAGVGMAKVDLSASSRPPDQYRIVTSKCNRDDLRGSHKHCAAMKPAIFPPCHFQLPLQLARVSSRMEEIKTIR